MTIRNLDYMFSPTSVVLIGASSRAGSVGAMLARNLFRGTFAGKLYCVHPTRTSVEGVKAYARVADLPEAPDLAVIATPRDTVIPLVAELGRIGTRAVVVISAGFGDADSTGTACQQMLLDTARPYLMRVMGPNTLGVLLPRLGVNASFAHLDPLPGHLAFVAQSGAILTSVIDWANARNFGFSHLVSVGDMADVDFGDMLDYLANDPQTHAILLYAESLTSGRKFMSAARAAARRKPVIAIKAGRVEAGARAAASHTGAMEGADDVCEAALRRAGIVRVDGLEDLFAAAEVLASARQPRGESLTIVTNGGGMGVLASDQLVTHGGQLAQLTPQTCEALNAVLPKHWSHSNPVDIVGDATAERYAQVLGILAEQPGAGTLLVLHCPTGVASSEDAADAVIALARKKPSLPILTAWVGEQTTQVARQRLARNGVPCYQGPTRAINAFLHLQKYHRGQENLLETPASIPEEFYPDRKLAQALIDSCLRGGRSWMHPLAVRELLAAYGIPTLACELAQTPAEAAVCAQRMDRPVALKLLSPGVVHKTDAGMVALNLRGAETVERTATQMQDRLYENDPDAVLDGFLVEPMLQERDSIELITGVSEDPVFGPMILFGQGGTRAELIDDKALGLPPLTMHLARDQMQQTRVWKLLQGYRGQPGVDCDALAMVLIKLGHLVADHPQIRDIEINPLVAHPKGVVALDARCRLDASGKTDRLAIRPYPSELEEDIALEDGRLYLLRPIMPEDEPALLAAFKSLPQNDIRMRFFTFMKSLPHRYAARLSQIDYDREMAFALTQHGRAGATDVYGVVRMFADPDNEKAEFAVIVLRSVRGIGLGTLLMQRLINYARGRGVQEMYGDVLQENRPMRGLCQKLGFTTERIPHEPGVVRVRLDLRVTQPWMTA